MNVTQSKWFLKLVIPTIFLIFFISKTRLAPIQNENLAVVASQPSGEKNRLIKTFLMFKFIAMNLTFNPKLNFAF